MSKLRIFTVKQRVRLWIRPLTHRHGKQWRAAAYGACHGRRPPGARWPVPTSRPSAHDVVFGPNQSILKNQYYSKIDGTHFDRSCETHERVVQRSDHTGNGRTAFLGRTGMGDVDTQHDGWLTHQALCRAENFGKLFRDYIGNVVETYASWVRRIQLTPPSFMLILNAMLPNVSDANLPIVLNVTHWVIKPSWISATRFTSAKINQ